MSQNHRNSKGGGDLRGHPVSKKEWKGSVFSATSPAGSLTGEFGEKAVKIPREEKV